MRYTLQQHVALGFALLLLGLGAGCDQQKPVTATNIAGSWEAGFDDTVAVITFTQDNEFVIDAQSSGMGGGGLFYLSGWGKLPTAGTYRLDDNEITFQVEGATVSGATVTGLTENTLEMHLDAKAPIEWKRVQTGSGMGVPAGGPAGGPSDGGTTLSGDADIENGTDEEMEDPASNGNFSISPDLEE